MEGEPRGELLHIFFLDKQLKDFLETTSLSDLEGVKRFLYEKGRSRDIIHLYSKTQSNRVVYQFALHLPYESEGYAFSLTSRRESVVWNYIIHWGKTVVACRINSM